VPLFRAAAPQTIVAAADCRKFLRVTVDIDYSPETRTVKKSKKSSRRIAL
jgi:hypothetical protein